ncbi:MAG: bifunctional phosphoglucose/phosphomannose isomerase [Anaerolineales bacterium]
MNLDQPEIYPQIDPQNMLNEINGLPDQLLAAWQQGLAESAFFSAAESAAFRRILISGMGGSAIGADLLAAYLAPLCRLPIFVSRDYDLPAWASGAETLVIASSHSGNTEETLSAAHQALERGCRLLAICTGGKLAALAAENRAPLWKFTHAGQPRAAVGFSFGLLLAAMQRLGLIPDQDADLRAAVAAMQAQKASLTSDIPVSQNPAKRMAGQLVGRHVTIFGAGLHAPIARRWKGQINEIANSLAQFEILPEANHNTLQGLEAPQEILTRGMALFLRAPSDHPRNRLRIELTRQAFMLEGLNTDFLDARGATRLEQLWTLLHFGDYLAYYLAIAYGIDPTPIAALVNFKAAMSRE